MEKKIVHNGKELIPYMSSNRIQLEVKRVAQEISRDYQGKNPVLIGVLNGAYVFLADLMRQIDHEIKAELDFLKISSYDGTKSTGIVKALSEIKSDIKGRHVIIVEDIVETGQTIQKVVEELNKKEPASIKLASCFHKPNKAKVNIKIDYLAFEVLDKFIIGYGLDWNEFGRGLDALYYIEE